MTTTLEAPATIYTATTQLARAKRNAINSVAVVPEAPVATVSTKVAPVYSFTTGRIVIGVLLIIAGIWGYLVSNGDVAFGGDNAMLQQLNILVAIIPLGIVWLCFSYMANFRAGKIDGIFGEKN